MQGKLPCDYCPYGRVCDVCPELKVRAEGKKVHEKRGFYSRVVREVTDVDGKKHYTYSHYE